MSLKRIGMINLVMAYIGCADRIDVESSSQDEYPIDVSIMDRNGGSEIRIMLVKERAVELCDKLRAAIQDLDDCVGIGDEVLPDDESGVMLE